MSLQDEWTLSLQLRKECDRSGREVKPKQSAKILHQLGLVYRGKSPDKQNMIQSVALMTSAILREPDNIEEVKQDLDEVCSHVFQLAKAANKSISLNDFMVKIKQQIREFRQTIQQALDMLKPIPDFGEDAELAAERNEKVKEVSAIGDLAAEMYTCVMERISDYCVEVLGDPPCQFALVGMGSLARREITPYSDFESIIVLEEGVQERSNYEQCLNYFRWFATIFQVVLVRLGETVLRFLAIPCLNDPLEPEHNWFYDAHTPCGISPDGFAPNASKNPLGCQRPPQYELIKPVREMVKYLDTADDESYLADILMKTCFVAGNSAVHESFSSLVDEIVQRRIPNETHCASFLQQIKSNLKRLGLFLNLQPAEWKETFDVKRLLYRSCTLFVSTLGRWYGIKESSCLDVLDKLMEREHLRRADYEELRLAVAIACEVRLRFYAERNSQSDIFLQNYFLEQSNDTTRAIAESVGTKALADSLVAANSSHESMHIFLTVSSTLPNRFLLNPTSPLVCLNICHVLKLYDKVVEFCEKIFLPAQHRLERQDQIDLLDIYAQNLVRIGRQGEAIPLIKKNLSVLRRTDLTENLCRLYCLLGECLLDKGEYKKALKYLRKTNSYVHFHLADPKYFDVALSRLVADCFIGLRRYRKALRWMERECAALEKKGINRGDHRYYQCVFNKARCLILVGDHAKAKTVLEDLKDCRLRLTQDRNDTWLQNIEQLLFLCRHQIRLRETERPGSETLTSQDLSTGHVSGGVREIVESIAPLSPFDSKVALSVHGNITPLQQHYTEAQKEYFKRSFQKAISILQKSLSIYSEKSISHRVGQEVAGSEMFWVMHQYGVAMCRCLMVECLIELRQFGEALRQGRLAWIEMSRLPWRGDFIQSRVRALWNLGNCHFYSERLSESRPALEQALYLALLIYKNPILEPLFVVTASSLVKCYARLKVKNIAWGYQNSPSTFYKVFLSGFNFHFRSTNTKTGEATATETRQGARETEPSSVDSSSSSQGATTAESPKKMQSRKTSRKQPPVELDGKSEAEMFGDLPLSAQQFLREREENFDRNLQRIVSESFKKLILKSKNASSDSD